MPVVKLSWESRRWCDLNDLIRGLTKIVGPRTDSDDQLYTGRGWRVMYTTGDSDGKKYYRLTDPKDSPNYCYRIEIDDPRLATYFALKYA